jgi:aminoglycoside 6'-N-acetyltransferase I
MSTVAVRPVEQRDEASWVEMRSALWPDGMEDHPKEIQRFLAGDAKEPLAVLVAQDGEALVGFVELSIRPYAEGCVTDRVAYVEGWYVKDGHRRSGVGGALIAGAEEWGRKQGCVELASDAELTNSVSQKAHLALGFDEVLQIRCFHKSIEMTGGR